ncbi:SDR family oxidoreductase [Streptomyces graminilatus]|uniref:SDR family oxidoreductase n=1 Tax=Streptomyces graminilatus TaxID=1464070 RepID=UPI0006E15E05|nr:SDR family oxidoreductase [Streptomyces graminilatus]
MNVVLVTGCSSGIGAATAVEFARRGAVVYATMRDPARSEKLRKTADAEGLTLRLLTLDVTDDASVESAVRTVLEEEGRLDILVNNAGVGDAGPVETIAMDRARAVYETNVWGPVRLARAVLPSMRERRSGVIVNVGSIAGRLPGMPHSGFYGSSKHALSLLTEALSWEVAPFGIRALIVEPEFFATEIFNHGVIDSTADGPYSADHEWANNYVVHSSAQADRDPAEAAEAIVTAALDPESPVHVLVGPTAAAFTETAAAVGSFENWVKAATQMIETVCGPRPTAPTPGT